MKFTLAESRYQHLWDQFLLPYFLDLCKFLYHEKENQTVIYPSLDQIFCAFDLTTWDEVRVVILGQDPYHGAGQAHGLAFSVQDGVVLPPSLRNIYKELVDDIGCLFPISGDLTSRAQQGVLLLNTTLTVASGKSLSHSDRGREIFTDQVIGRLSDQKEWLIFLLRGSHAQSKQSLIDGSRHHILTAPHPSPLSAYRGRFGSKHFSQTNHLLQGMGKDPIDRCI